MGTLPGRALILGVAIKALAFTLTLLPQFQSLGVAHDVIDTLGDVALLGGGTVILYRLYRVAQARLLWRVRRKLILSYVFIGVIPALLIITFFLLSGLLMFYNISSYLMQTRLRSLMEEGRFLAQAAALELEGAGTPDLFRITLNRRQALAAIRYPGVSSAIVPVRAGCLAGGTPRPVASLTSGPWAHLPAPQSVPEWMPCAGFAGLLAYTDPADRSAPELPRRTHLVVRAVARPDEPATPYAVVVDIPIGPELTGRLRDDSGIAIGEVTPVSPTGSSVIPLEPPEDFGARRAGVGIYEPSGGVFTTPDASGGDSGGVLRRPLQWVSLLDYTDWSSGRPGAVMVAIRMSVGDIYERISSTPVQSIGNISFGQLLLIGLALVGGSFLVIQSVAFVMGLALARSITGSVHGLFAGTERVGRGDFTHKIAIQSRDQLGELARSFNSMTASIEDLLQQKAEKERMEQELRIARQIQMSLLPHGPLRMAGLTLSAHCEPAREVGGDYYDYFLLDSGRLGILIADVAGKGTSAALYMAELKGLMLSLSQLYRSPRELLIAANGFIAPHLDERSFITMTYAVVDLQASTLTYARAGHCPLIYLPGALSPSPGRVQVLTPDGMVLGLKLDLGERFTEILEEVTLPLASGDLFVLFTDGLTEAMNPDDDCFGESRLCAIVEDHGDAAPDVMRERILREIAAFTAPAGPHDDLTMLILKIEGGPDPSTGSGSSRASSRDEGPPLRPVDVVEAGL